MVAKWGSVHNRIDNAVKGGTASDFDAAGDIAGKLVLVDVKMSSWWFTWPAFEAGHRKAAGVICTFTSEDPKYFSVDDSALGSFDGQMVLMAAHQDAHFRAGVDAFRTAAADFDARAGAIPAGRTDAVNEGLLEVEKAINSGLTALSPADEDATVYPHQAVLRDAQGINAALAALKADRPNIARSRPAIGPGPSRNSRPCA